jgi:hypothetical protein
MPLGLLQYTLSGQTPLSGTDYLMKCQSFWCGTIPDDSSYNFRHGGRIPQHAHVIPPGLKDLFMIGSSQLKRVLLCTSRSRSRSSRNPPRLLRRPKIASGTFHDIFHQPLDHGVREHLGQGTHQSTGPSWPPRCLTDASIQLQLRVKLCRRIDPKMT